MIIGHFAQVRERMRLGDRCAGREVAAAECAAIRVLELWVGDK